MVPSERLRAAILSTPIMASDGNHSMRLDRVLINLIDHARSNAFDPENDRLLHLSSRVGVFSRSLANDLRSGHVSVSDAATLLDQLANIGDLSFDEWRGK